MAKGGQFVAGTPPYGYMLDPEDKHHLIPDHNEVDVVKKYLIWLYQEVVDQRFASILMIMEFCAEKNYKGGKKRKLTLEPFEIKSQYLWSTSTIGRMLHNEVYIGNLVQLKTTRATFGCKKLFLKMKMNVFALKTLTRE